MQKISPLNKRAAMPIARNSWLLLGLLFLLPRIGSGQMQVQPGNPDGIYALGADVTWQVQLTPAPTETVAATYVVKRHGAQTVASGSLDLSSGLAEVTFPGVQNDEPCALLLSVTASLPTGMVTALGGAAVAPEQIEPLYEKPADFDAFWDAKLAAQRALPMSVELVEEPSGRAGVLLWTVSINTLHGSTSRAQIARPSAGDSFPALAILQGAGVYALKKSTVVDRAAQGWLAINMMPHDLPLYESDSFYADQLAGPLAGYGTQGNHDREEAYLLGMLLRAVRAMEYLTTRDDWDGQTLVTSGGSQGGFQSIAMAALEPQVTQLLANIPAVCEQSGPRGGRSAPWPYWYNRNVTADNQDAIHEAGRYFDTVNFATRVQVPALVGMGLIDTTSPASGVFSMINRLGGTADVVIMPLAPHSGANDAHAAYREAEAELLDLGPLSGQILLDDFEAYGLGTQLANTAGTFTIVDGTGTTESGQAALIDVGMTHKYAWFDDPDPVLTFSFDLYSGSAKAGDNLYFAFNHDSGGLLTGTSNISRMKFSNGSMVFEAHLNENEVYVDGSFPQDTKVTIHVVFNSTEVAISDYANGESIAANSVEVWKEVNGVFSVMGEALINPDKQALGLEFMGLVTGSTTDGDFYIDNLQVINGAIIPTGGPAVLVEVSLEQSTDGENWAPAVLGLYDASGGPVLFRPVITPQ